MANTTRLPRISIEGLTPFNDWADALADAVERALNVRGVGVVSVEKTATGLIIKAATLGDVWAYLSPSQSVSAASGLTLGSGPVTLCNRTPNSGVLVSTGQVVTAYNAGGALSGGGGATGYALKLGVMRDGSYSIDVVICAAAV